MFLMFQKEPVWLNVVKTRRAVNGRSGTRLGRVERLFNKIKHCRRVATRYDRLAANYLAFIQLASIRLWLRANESAS